VSEMSRVREKVQAALPWPNLPWQWQIEARGKAKRVAAAPSCYECPAFMCCCFQSDGIKKSQYLMVRRSLQAARRCRCAFAIYARAANSAAV